MTGPTAQGGGAYCDIYSSPIVANTIVAFNSSGIRAPLSGLTLWHSCVYGNTAYDYPTGTNGNISANPLFRSANPGPDGTWATADDVIADLRLQAGSPCIDAADNARVSADSADLDSDGNTTEPLPFDLAGRARLVDDPATVDTGSGTAPLVDMGAYEFFPTARADFNQDGYVDGEDLARLYRLRDLSGSRVQARGGAKPQNSL